MKRAAWAGLALACCAPVDLRFGHDAGADAGPADAGAPDAGPCGGCAGLPLRCDLDAGACVECQGDGDCAAPHGACDPTTGRCVECVTAQQCGAGQGCDTVTHRCGKACSTLLDCLIGFEGCGGANLCRLCDDDPECASDPGGPLCELRIGRCVECRSSADCTAPRPLCDVTRGRCAGCLVGADCGAGRACDAAVQRCAP